MSEHRAHPFRWLLFLAVLAVFFHAIGADIVVAILGLVALFGLLLSANRKPPEVEEDPAEMRAAMNAMAEQVTAGAAEYHRYKALLAALLLNHPEGFKIDAETAEAADRLEVYVAPTPDGGIVASAGYPVAEDRASA